MPIAAVAPVVNGQTLAYPRGYTETIFYKGTVKRMASGDLVRELTDASRKLRFRMEWTGLTVTERGNVETALGYLEDGTARSFTSPRNQTYTVVLAEDGEPEWTVIRASAGTVLRYSGTLTLEEV